MRKIMLRYRVQTKPGVDIPAGTTARDALGDRLLVLWRDGGPDDATRARIGSTIDEFRMQLKQSGVGAVDKPAPASAPARPAKPPSPPSSAAARPTEAPRPAKAAALSTHASPAAHGSPPSASPSSPPRPAGKPAASVQLGVADPPVRMPRGPEPIAGGPRTRKKARGECPKCKSKGVVLARSYSGDEYYSCIYCGWQAYKAVDEDDPNASLAVRLLGPTAGTE
jgi:hypothetical protein